MKAKECYKFLASLANSGFMLSRAHGHDSRAHVRHQMSPSTAALSWSRPAQLVTPSTKRKMANGAAAATRCAKLPDIIGLAYMLA